ncbi:hypothetical protein [Cellulomonas sp. KRMCY2]|uniref:hypothetical protein n=1 Tax=Cellulomonas sp. KRMCY2 TaxID=1304865 RepID=UPI0004AE6D63|nr:hypothetical protein [Cellulomonas sp. KRMCY2]
MSESRPTAATTAGVVLAALAGSAAVGLAAWTVVTTLMGGSPVSWVLGRASGLTSYLLLLALVTTGLVLSHPWARGMRRPSPAGRLRLHIALATFTLAFTVLHVVVLATDPWAQVGWRGALLPLASTYRPVPVTLGVLALWAGLLTGITARLAGSIAARIWWPVHKVAAGILVLVWSHSVLAGSDTPTLRWFYVSTGVAVIGLAITRYSARTPTDRVAELNRELGASVARAVPHAAYHDGASR